MDDFSIRDDRLERALHELCYVNKYLGGYRALHHALTSALSTQEGRPLAILDVGCGIGDHAVDLVRWGRRQGRRIYVTGIDANPETVRIARDYVSRSLTPVDRGHVEIRDGDALDAPFADASFDVATASLFLHHFEDAAAVRLMREMRRLARLGIVVNDLHRHPLAYAGIRSIAAVLPVSPMFRHDGPLSVRRAFTPRELLAMGRSAGLDPVRVRRHWAYRLTLSSLPDADSGGS